MSELELERVANDFDAPQSVRKQATGELMGREKERLDRKSAIVAEENLLQQDLSTESEGHQSKSSQVNDDLDDFLVKQCSRCGDLTINSLIGFPKTYCWKHKGQYCPFCGKHTEYDESRVCAGCEDRKTIFHKKILEIDADSG